MRARMFWTYAPYQARWTRGGDPSGSNGICNRSCNIAIWRQKWGMDEAFLPTTGGQRTLRSCATEVWKSLDEICRAAERLGEDAWGVVPTRKGLCDPSAFSRARESCEAAAARRLQDAIWERCTKSAGCRRRWARKLCNRSSGHGRFNQWERGCKAGVGRGWFAPKVVQAQIWFNTKMAWRRSKLRLKEHHLRSPWRGAGQQSSRRWNGLQPGARLPNAMRFWPRGRGRTPSLLRMECRPRRIWQR